MVFVFRLSTVESVDSCEHQNCSTCGTWIQVKVRVRSKESQPVYITSMHVQLPTLANTVEPPNKGANDFVPCREVVPISEGPLSEVPLCTILPLEMYGSVSCLYTYN